MFEIIFVIIFLVVVCGVLASCGVLWYLLLFALAVAGITMMIIGGFLMVTCSWTGKVMKETGKVYEKQMEAERQLYEKYPPRREGYPPPPTIQIAISPNLLEAERKKK